MNDRMPIRAGVFENEPAADRAVAGLLDAGIPKEKIRIVSQRPVPHHDDHPNVETITPSGSHTSRTAIAGGAIGAIVGIIAAVVIGRTSTWTWQMLVCVLVGATVIGSVVGGFIGAMMSRGFEPEIADFHDQAMEPDQYLVAVDVDAVPAKAPIDEVEAEAEAEDAEDVLVHAGATAAVPLHKS